MVFKVYYFRDRGNGREVARSLPLILCFLQKSWMIAERALWKQLFILHLENLANTCCHCHGTSWTVADSLTHDPHMSAKLHKRVWLTEIWILWQLLLSLLQVYRMARIWVNLSEHFIWFSEEINNRVKGQCPSLDSQHILEHSDEEDPQVNDRTVLIKLARTTYFEIFYISYGSTI